MVKKSVWASADVERLKNLYLAKGMTAINIAKEFGMTKNAVIGKIHRLKLPLLKGEAVVEVVEKTKPVVKQKQGQYTLIDIEYDMCIWPYGEDEFTFCGDKVAEGKRYCQKHFDLVYLSPKKMMKKKYSEESDAEEIDEVEIDGEVEVGSEVNTEVESKVSK